MVGTLGIIMVCMSALAQHCHVVTSPYVFSSVDECKADALREASRLKDKYKHVTVTFDCVALRYNGEPV